MIWWIALLTVLLAVETVAFVIAVRRGLAQIDANDEIVGKIESSLKTLRGSLSIINKATRTEVAFNDPVVRGVIRAVNNSKESLEQIISDLEDVHEQRRKAKESSQAP